MKLPDFSIIILAAGDSSRLGQPKQFLMFKGKTLIARIIDEAVNSGACEILVVSNPNDIKITEFSNLEKVRVVPNPDWKRGISTSIAAGIKKVRTDEVIIVLCDQPYVTTELLKQLVEKKIENKKSIACCSYAGSMGTPAAFNRSYFEVLTNLNGDEGAKKIIMSNLADTHQIEFPDGVVDIDTDVDYRKIL